MFLLIFLWTPPHFWALALFVKDDFSKAGVPMLTVTHGHAATRRHIFAYSVLLALFAIGIGFTAIGGPAYLLTAVVLNALMVKGAWDVLARHSGEAEAETGFKPKSVSSACL